MGTWKVLSKVKDDNGVTYTELESHDCTKSELGLENGNDSNSDFFPPDRLRDTKKILDSYAEQLKCFDSAKLQFQGDIDSATSRQVVIKYEFCNSSQDSCMQKEQAEAEMNQKSFMILAN